jgi:predicted ATPase
MAIRQMLERSPTLQILATSRRAMRITGEQELPILPLPLPMDGIGEPLGHQPAIALFVDRARSVNPRFSTDETSLSAVAELCRRVDGLPLAIELAAARTRLLAPQAMLQRLRSGFDLLSSRNADLPARQQTLRATLDWSYDLLSTSERCLLARLSVFDGSFSLDAAATVCGDESVNIEDDLTGLLDCSLMLPSDEPEIVEPRFHMLQTVRDYAADRLGSSGEIDVIRKRFIAWLLQLSHRAAPFLCGPHQHDWATRLDAERANLRAVIRATLAAGDFKSAIELTWNTTVFYEIRAANAEPQAWTSEIIASKPMLDTVTEARLRLIVTQFRVNTGDFDGADAALASIHDVFTADHFPLERAVILMVWSDVHLHLRNDLPAAREMLRKSMQLFESMGHDWGIARTQIMMSLLYWMDGQTEAAKDWLKESLVRSRRIENEPQIAHALSLLAMLGSSADNSDILLLRDAAKIVVRGRYRSEAAACLEALALSRQRAGRKAEADKAASLSERIRHQLQLHRPRPIIGALSAAGLLTPRFDSLAKPPADTTFAFLSEMLLMPEPPQDSAAT